ncbi:YtzI protein [Anaerobacillus sp. MEB173]|uniref:YtzI protein n=1 Tax=Anaerobacillus sp. MEB173 TaxID=3383345 RepID=UPI003F91C93C
MNSAIFQELSVSVKKKVIVFVFDVFDVNAMIINYHLDHKVKGEIEGMLTVVIIAVLVMLLILVLSIAAISKGYSYQEKVDEIDERKPSQFNQNKDNN